eukprot:4928172-Amphidinium_carterae.2
MVRTTVLLLLLLLSPTLVNSVVSDATQKVAAHHPNDHVISLTLRLQAAEYLSCEQTLALLSDKVGGCDTHEIT